MGRMTLAGVIGAVLAVVSVFLVVAVVSAVGGVPVMFDPDREVSGWEGAQYGMMLLVLIGVGKVWPFPAIALGGAAIGVLVGLAVRPRAGTT
jgi:hypothetical protein